MLGIYASPDASIRITLSSSHETLLLDDPVPQCGTVCRQSCYSSVSKRLKSMSAMHNVIDERIAGSLLRKLAAISAILFRQWQLRCVYILHGLVGEGRHISLKILISDRMEKRKNSWSLNYKFESHMEHLRDRRRWNIRTE